MIIVGLVLLGFVALALFVQTRSRFPVFDALQPSVVTHKQAAIRALDPSGETLRDQELLKAVEDMEFETVVFGFSQDLRDVLPLVHKQFPTTAGWTDQGRGQSESDEVRLELMKGDQTKLFGAIMARPSAKRVDLPDLEIVRVMDRKAAEADSAFELWGIELPKGRVIVVYHVFKKKLAPRLRDQVAPGVSQ